MPTQQTVHRAQAAKRAGKSAASQAGEFVREEIHKIRRGEHGARSAKQAIAIGLNMARRAGVDLPPPKPGKTSGRTRRSAALAYRAGRHPTAPSPRRSRAATRALKREPRAAASHTALSRHARAAARSRTARERSAASRKAARTKGPAGRHAAARKAARTRARQGK